MRGYSYEFIKRVVALATLPNAPIGVQLGAKAINKGIPVLLIAKTLGVSRMAVYDWFTGKYNPTPAMLKSLKQIVARKH